MEVPRPEIIKSCSRCRARKVKCDLQLPQCSACIRHSEDCNIAESAAYSYHTVETLLRRIRELEAGPLASDGAPIPAGTGSSHNRSKESDGREQDLSREAEEIGSLAIGGPSSYSEGAYVGSASGSTFARIFFKQLSLGSEHRVTGERGRPDRVHIPRQASLPSWSVARHLLGVYVARVHVWWPFLALPFVRSVFDQVYHDPQECGDYEKFLVFAVLALGGQRSNSSSKSAMDLNTPDSYFETCLNFFSGFSDRAAARKLPSIHAVLLLGLWLLETPRGLGDMWHLSRHAMSSAIEAGLHRHHADWGFGADEVEIRNRTWWCVYNMERHVAILTGRVLSIRDHAVQTPLPVHRPSLDHTASSSRAEEGEQMQSVEPFKRLIELRRLSGRVLESVYVRRHQPAPGNSESSSSSAALQGNMGEVVNTSLQQICAAADAIGLELAAWDQRLTVLFATIPSCAQREERGESIVDQGITAAQTIQEEYLSELRVESSLLQLLLYRPSPAFMVPSAQMVQASGRAARTAMTEWMALEKRRNSSEFFKSVRYLHAVLLAGLAGLYCDWRTIRALPDATRLPPGTMWLESDTEACMGLIERGVLRIGERSYGRYRDVFKAARAKVYINKPMLFEVSDGTMAVMAPEAPEGVEMWDMPMLESELDGYLSQVGDLLDDAAFGLDETVNEWYAALTQGTTWTAPPAEPWGR